MAEPRDDEFYVGYLPRAPRGIAAFVRAAVALVFLVAAAVSLLLVGAQRPFGPGVFEYGVRTELEGLLRETPYPLLQVPRPGRAGAAPAFSTYYLSAFGKRGAERIVAGLDGCPVRLRGSLIYRDDRTMLEIEDGSVELLEGADAERLGSPAPPAEESLGVRTLVGEIVDSKCFLGVMKPGHLKPHRGCATRCISGGVPPVFVVLDGQGRATYYLLVSDTNEAVNDRVLELVAEPVEITGEVVRLGDLLVLRADPDAYRRLGS